MAGNSSDSGRAAGGNVTAAPNGDWGAFVEAYSDRVFKVAYRILGSSHDAEDVVQEVFVEVFGSRRDEQVLNWGAVLVQKAVHRAIDQLRKRRRQVFVPVIEDHRITEEDPALLVAARELRDWLRHQLCELPTLQATVFAMSSFDGLSREEIATALRITPDGVSSALYKARKALQDQLAVAQRATK